MPYKKPVGSEIPVPGPIAYLLLMTHIQKTVGLQESWIFP